MVLDCNNSWQLLSNIFPIKSIAASTAQDQSAALCALFKQCIDAWHCLQAKSELFHGADPSKPFAGCNLHHLSSTAPTCLAADEIKTLAKAAAIISSESVAWFPEFGCVLLALQPKDDSGIDVQLVPGHMALHLVGLDGWLFDMHSTASSTFHTSWCNGSAALCCGTVPASSLSALVATTRRLIQERKEERAKDNKKGFQRTPAFILAVIKDALKQLQGHSTSTSSVPSMPRGGFTDVGLHTGGTPKATSWPLVQQTLLVVLALAGICTNEQEPHSLLHLAMAQFELWLLQQVLQHLSADTATAATLADIVLMLESASKKAAALAMAGHDMAAYEAACQVARHVIDGVAADRAVQLAGQYTLPADIGSSCGQCSLPTGVLPARLAPDGQDMGLAAAKHAAAAALGSLPLADTAVGSGSFAQQLQRLLQQSTALSATATSSDTAALLLLSSTEHVLFSRAVAGFQQPGCTLASAQEVQLLEQVLDSYRSALYSFRNTAAASALWQKELRSLELLVVWVCYWLMFEEAQSQFKVMQQYGVALQWADLQYAVLPNKFAVDAARSVAAYLAQHTVPGKQLFSLANSGQATFSFAHQHAAQCSHLTGIWEHEKQQAQQRVDKRWAEVQRKQRLAAELRTRACALNQEIAALQHSMAPVEEKQQDISKELSGVEARLYYYTYHGRRGGRCVRNKRDDAELEQQEAQLQAQKEVADQLRPLQQHKQALQSALNTTQKQLKVAEQAPLAIIQPLPSDRHTALQWLFFLHMPELLHCLSRCSFLAQQLLLPLPANSNTAAEVHSATTVVGLNMSLASHYNTHQANTYHTVPRVYSGTDGCVKLYSAKSVPALSSIGPSHVDSISNPQIGVWHPDSLTPSMAWAGTGTTADSGLNLPSGFFNPFATVRKHLVAASFTDQLPPAYNSLQWAMLLESWAATPADRGNLGIARQHERPDWLPKPAYLMLTSLRSYPLLQWQRLCRALREQTLPLGHPAVLALIMQAVHHVGELVLTRGHSSGSSSSDMDSACQVQLLWRSDWDKPGGALDAMGYELRQLADKLAEAPREHDAVLLLGQLAAYLADWSPACKSIAGCFAAMTSKAADQMQMQVEQAAQQQQDSMMAQLQAKQCKARALSLLCYGAGPVDAAAVGHMLKLIVLVKHGDVCLAGASAGTQLHSLTTELQQLRVQCRQVMARQLPAVLAILKQPEAHNQLLTAAVSAVLERAPQQLQWKQVASSSSSAAMSTASFHSEGGDGHLYSVNILDGTVLLDGAPPGRLPGDILQHPMYQRAFGSSNFEISVARTGERTTLRPVNGCFYNFYWTSAGSTTAGETQRQLVIEEIEKGSGARLQLLDVGQDGGGGCWGKQLPVRLRQLHSHWYNREHAAILLRPKDFKSHSLQFIIGCSPAGDATSMHMLYCWRVPHHLTCTPWQQLLQLPQHVQQLKAAQLVLLQQSQPVLGVLSKFEDPRFIHAYMPCSAACSSTNSGGVNKQLRKQHGFATSTTVQCSWQLQFELPRFRLEFELQDNGHLVSRDNSGFRLSCCQQLIWTPETQVIARSSSSSSSTCTRVSSSAQGSLMSVALASSGSNVSGSSIGSDDVPSRKTAALQLDLNGLSSDTGSSLMYTLPDFRQYLVLEPTKSGPSSTAAPEKLVLVPAGSVKLDNAGRPTVEVHQAAGAGIRAHKYSIHPRFCHLRASSVSARLQLAALYAASSSLLPEPSSQMTGAQLAMQLIRQSWVNTPLTKADMQNLHAAAALAGHLAPALRLLSCELEASTRQLRHLHVAAGGATSVSAAPQAGPEACQASSDAISEYMLKAQHVLPGGWTMHPSLRLQPEEEARLIGASSLAKAAAVMPAWKKLTAQYSPVVVPACPVPSGFLAECDEKLQALVLTSHPGISSSIGNSSSSSGVQSYPLKPGVEGSSTPLERMQHEDLEKSWIAHHRMQTPDSVAANCTTVIQAMQVEVIAKRKRTQDHVMHHLSSIPDTTGAPGASFRLLRHSGAVLMPSTLHLLPCAWQPELLLQYNPFLSPSSVCRLHEAVLMWLQLCVLEDKLGRLVQPLRAGQEATTTLIQELLVHRTWDVALHPKWLVFEVEGQLQIRPAQYDIAQHLMANPGAIMQLNMGEGKTRVILPMLALRWATDKKWVVRLNFLSTLLPEAFEHLHQHLTASVLGVKLVLMPFHRDVSLSAESARAMRAAVSHCQRVGGLLLVVPEHRMSLELKWYELRLKGDKESLAVCQELAALAAMPYLDILDESDELLHHRFQLVYACGDRQPLFARPERVAAIQALLHALNQLADAAPSACPELHKQGVAVWPPVAERPPGSFCGVQLLSGGPLESVLPDLHLRLAVALLANPPYEMRWIGSLEHQDAVLQFITDASASFAQLLASAPGLTADQADQLLTLRGLLACNMLQHCLQKRHNVDFGINRGEAARKRLAVPYRAAHTPSDRSEFAQPDVALLLTHVSYYGDGLTLEQFRQAVDQLLSMGENARQAYCRNWLRLLPANRIAPGDLVKFDAADKVDPTNPQQLLLMWRHMQHNMAVVDLWLSYCLLPNETSQFPQRLTRNAWHLADNTAGQVVGFSGTNDNHRLLPLRVHQADAAGKPHLAATNGRMLARLLQQARYCTLQRQEHKKGSKPVWQAVLDYAMKHKLHALLDCGALLAGTTNRDAAWYVLQHMDPSLYQGVCYFHTDTQQWTICDSLGRSLARQASPVAERETFVIHDEARCRGADLKLQQQAVGLLTLAPGICKDKLMQAAGRMRQLGRGQTLHVVGLPDVADKIKAANSAPDRTSPSSDSKKQLGPVDAVTDLLGCLRPRIASSGQQISMQHVLQWVMSNTVQSTLHGVTQWASQGLYFAVSKGSPDRALQQDELCPKDLYGGSKAARPVAEVVSSMVRHQLKAVRHDPAADAAAAMDSGGGCAAANNLPALTGSGRASGASSSTSASGVHCMLFAQQIEASASKYGEGHMVVAGAGVHEECERELEQEEEQEEEQEVQVPKVDAAAEQDWDYASAFTAASANQLPAAAGVSRLTDAVHLLQPRSIASIGWSGSVYVTNNFMLTTAPAARAAAAAGLSGCRGREICLSDYLRPIDSMVVFQGGEVLFLSEREADAVVELLWRTAADGSRSTSSFDVTRPLLKAGTKAAQNLLLNLPYTRLARSSTSAAQSASMQTPSRATFMGQLEGHVFLAHLLSYSSGAMVDARMMVGRRLHADQLLHELVSAHLFNGGAMFDGDRQQLQHLHSMVHGRREAAEALLDVRGRQAQFPRSELELACDAAKRHAAGAALPADKRTCTRMKRI